jgi:hypothetical protein
MPHVDSCSRSAELVREGVSGDAFAELWSKFRKHLATRIRDINDEVARYPRPIARCDVQLSKLLEERARVYRQLNLSAELGNPRSDTDARWLRRVDDYLAKLEACADDDVEADLRCRLLKYRAQIRG